MPLPRAPRRSISALALACVFLAGACGSGDTALQKVQADKTIVIGTSGNNAPTIFRDPSAGLVGIDADWAAIIAKKLGAKVQWKIVDFQGIVPGLQAHQFDAAMSGLRVTPERQKVIDFSDPIGYDEATVVFPAGMAGITGPNDIKGRTVCVVAGSSNGELPVQRIGTAAKVTRYPGQAEAFADLKNRRCQVMVTGRILARHWIRSGQGAGFELSQQGTDGTPLAVGVPKGSDDLLKEINKAIGEAKKQGAYERIAQKWLGESFKH